MCSECFGFIGVVAMACINYEINYEINYHMGDEPFAEAKA